MKRRMIAVGLLVVSQASVAQADTHYVSRDGTNNHPYTNGWANASTNIQWAVSAASANDTVLISNGVYYLTNQIAIAANITVRGLTTNRELVIVNGNYPKNTNRCFSLVIDQVNAVLADMTITNGYVLGNGGGVSMEWNSGTVRNCLITGNYASGSGGGVYMSGGVLTNCFVVGNLATNGGGAYSSGSGSGTTIRNCVFTNNRAYVSSGGISVSAPNALIRDCSIVNNQSVSFGGGVFIASSGGLMTDCLIQGNFVLPAGAPWNGGAGVFLSQGSILNCRIIGNDARNGAAGGGVKVNGLNSQAVINCQIISNSDGYWSGGGGIALNCNGLIQNCLIVGNSNTNNDFHAGGGGIGSVDTLGSTVANCTVVNNSTVLADGAGVNARVQTTFINCVIYSNRVANAVTANWVSSVIMTNCCTYPTNSLSGSGNIASDPRFRDPASGNYRPIGSSPCVNSGLNQGWMVGASDLDGRPRIQYNQVDMGCYETIYQGTVFRGK